MRAFIIAVMLVLVTGAGFAADYANLVSLYHEFREFRQKDAPDGLPITQKLSWIKSIRN